MLIFISKLKISIFKIRINLSYKYNFNLETFFYESAYHVMYSICANKRMFCKVCVFVSVRWIVKSRAARSRKISLKTLKGGPEIRRSGSIFWYLAEIIVKIVSITAVKKHNPCIIKKEKRYVHLILITGWVECSVCLCLWRPIMYNWDIGSKGGMSSAEIFLRETNAYLWK